MPQVPPLIGITTYAVNDDGDIPLPHQYVASVRRAGGVPLLIPPGESRVDRILESIDGVVLAGGGDICPSRYGGCQHSSVYMVDTQRDASELALVEQLFQRRLPLLAICRGLQILNVATGGTLHVHVPDVVGEDILHRAPPRRPIFHNVDVSPESRLAAIMGATSVRCMSWHHQAIHRLGANCLATAMAPDGIIEAIEIADRPEVLALQWHPELTSDSDVSQQRIFDELIHMAQHSPSSM